VWHGIANLSGSELQPEASTHMVAQAGARDDSANERAKRLAEGLAYRDDSLTKHLMHLPSQKFIE